MLTRALAAALVTLAAVTACGGSGDESDRSNEGAGTATETTTQEIGDFEQGEISRSSPGHLRVEVRGDVAFEWDENVNLRIVVIEHPEVTAVRFLSVGIEQLQSLEDATAFRVAFDLAGVFDGAGDYELPKAGETRAGPDPGAAVAAGVSKPFLIYSPKGQVESDPTAVAELRSFENALQPCALEVREDDGGAGTLECPEVADSFGEGRIALRMEWEER